MIRKKLFLASSSELADERREFEIFINRKNKEWFDKGLFLDLNQWEDFLDAMSPTRLQDEYNKAIKDCELFVMLVWTKVGQYTEEEFETAVGQFKAARKPFVFTYFREAAAGTADASVAAFQKKLNALGHFYTRYRNIDQLKLHFGQQLDKLAANGFIEFPAQDGKPAAAPGNQATLQGGGAIAQGANSRAAGAAGVIVDGDNNGNIVTGGAQTIVNVGGGTYVNGNVTAGGDFVGRDKITHGTAAHDVQALLAPLLAVVSQAPAAVRTQAVEQVQQLGAEAAKGKQADDGRMGRIIDGLVAKVPGAVGAIVSAFASPLLGGVAGPVTKFVLDKLRPGAPSDVDV
jgi:hypothetical protein